MWLAMNATVTTMSSKPCRASSLTVCSIIGTFAMGIIGFGWLLVSGRRRVPSPPARITAFMRQPPLRRDRGKLAPRATPADNGEERVHRVGGVGDEEHRHREHECERACLTRPHDVDAARTRDAEGDGRDRDENLARQHHDQ